MINDIFLNTEQFLNNFIASDLTATFLALISILLIIFALSVFSKIINQQSRSNDDREKQDNV